ncbi:PREDICTED: structural maintenance of chromosomes protein 6B-like isoform X1 [Populus euphratica]|uniref:Structural maintenance of chromosomes protein 6B-like isoform X1 n=1 Tax=Populus euphratica TaxID=75702 RepID=A0AAJ6XRA0_POPEU|nr:PREDICTED: structural maintenance of chromosomes protein 6B-like isoform X1 [Populus euphratica]XP_011027954.1 PREDICTED: structural maintenance of chromosomes protein 6B-like isoform X1 [Populus euphratica]
MDDSRVFGDSNIPTTFRSGVGTISRIRLENFMCHDNLQIELDQWVNFVTGRNGSGKSAILTALCIAFGCRAKGTQRAATLKDFIKTGCSYAVVEVEVRNRGEESFKPDIYGDSIIIERRINQSSSTTVLKDHQGRKVASRREDLRELIEHFNIDVENPCVIMTQDKSREFLHSGNEKDKFKFFFKATLLQQVNDLLLSINEQLKSANALVDELEASIKPIEKELTELQGKIKNMEHLEEMSQQVQQLKKKLAWSWVYSVDKEIQEQMVKVGKLKERIPTCQARIDHELMKVEELRKTFIEKKAQTAHMVERAKEVRNKQDELRNTVSLARKKKLELENEHNRRTNQIHSMVKRVKLLEQQARDIHEQQVKNTQAEECEIEEKLKELQDMVDVADFTLSRLKEEESTLLESVSKGMDEIRKITEEIEEYGKKEQEIRAYIRELQLNKTNKVTAFGGDRVIQLLRTIERHHQRFRSPPIGPIGAHVTLANGDRWAPAVENAVGKLLNAFIVTDHRDSLLLRGCAREANYNNLQIIIYDFSRPRLTIPSHMLPQTNHPTTFSVIRSDNDTILNVLVDLGSAERQVLVEDYDAGKAVAFEKQISNLKEVYTIDGYKMFSRGSVQTVLPPNKKLRAGRLCGSFDDQIRNLDQSKSNVQKEADLSRKRKRDSEASLQHLQHGLKIMKEKCRNAERDLVSKKLGLQDAKNSYASATSSQAAASTVDELQQEISSIREEIQEKKMQLESLQVRINEADSKARDLELTFEDLRESVKEEIDAIEKAESELVKIEKDLQFAEAEKARYEGVMTTRVLPDIEMAEAQYRELEENRKESCRKASIICPESEIEALGGYDGSTPEQLSVHLNKLNQRLQNECQQHSDSIDDLRMFYQKKERKILRKRQTYRAFREKLKTCEEALNLRWSKFQRNASDLKRQLTWNFNGHLGEKGISGSIKISYEEKTLKVEVKMPQDASCSSVRDTRGLSGGERSFSTLCFALALHQMTEASFRAMDEFDVFMDAVSRKISLDTLVKFALAQGSQWIFITPHDISGVKHHERIKKQQLAAPRS